MKPSGILTCAAHENALATAAVGGRLAGKAPEIPDVGKLEALSPPRLSQWLDRNLWVDTLLAMARTHSQEHRQAARETWKRKLSTLAGQGGDSKISHQQLSMLLTVEFGQAPPAAAKLLREAAAELEAALAKVGEGSMEALDVWIDARLLTSSPKLLVTDEDRRKVFEQQRERKRRQNTTDQGKRSATITMPQAAWDQLAQLKQVLEQSSSTTVTLGDAVSALLSERIASAPPASKKKKRVATPLGESSGKKALTRQLDLLKQVPRSSPLA